MKTRLIAGLAAATIALAACENVNQDTVNTGGTAVAAGGLAALTASMLGANSAWTVAAGVAGATAGALYAKNRQTDECAYYTGNGDEVEIRPCP